MSIGSKLVLALSVSIGIAFSPASVEGHQRKEAYVTILFNTQSGNLEVSHRFLLHDANHALRRHFSVSGDLASDAATQSFFASYLQSRFSVFSEQQRLALSHVGFEVEGKYFWVYQEGALKDYKELTVEHTALHEIWPKQVNHINVELDGLIRSARLSVNTPKSSIDLTTAIKD